MNENLVMPVMFIVVIYRVFLIFNLIGSHRGRLDFVVFTFSLLYQPSANGMRSAYSRDH
jgi:hypothetical protein